MDTGSGIVVRGALVVDGTGAPGRRTDVGIADGRIAALGDRLTGRRVIDATGLVLAPGFIDMHAHSDVQILAEPEHTAKVSQGVTLEVLGQDGLSYAPVDDSTLATLREQLAGWNDDPARFDWSWRGVGEYLDRLDRGIACNAAYLLPQGTIRALTVGWDDRPATDAELAAMRELVATGMREGAAGMSSGLTYPPGGYAGTAELVALCEVVAAHGGYYSPHHRSYGAGALDAYAEMVAVSTRSGCPLHLAHATMNFPCNEGRAGELLALLDDAIAEGADITLDTYPYLPGATSLSALLPGWSADGRTGRHAGAARRAGDPRPHPGGPGGTRQRRVPRRAGGLAHDRGQRGTAPGARAPRRPQHCRIRRGARNPAVGAVLRHARRGAARHLVPDARGPRGQRARDHAAPGAHRGQRRAARR